MMDAYRRGWALRYLREAKAELEAARKMPYITPSLIIEAIRKARNAIYYSLGEPAFIEMVVKENVEKAKPTEDPFLIFLMEVEKMVQQLTRLEDIDGEKVMKKAHSLIQAASDVVETMTGEKVDD